MLIVMTAQAGKPEIEAICQKIRDLGFTPHPMPGSGRTAIGITGNPGPVPIELFADMPGVANAIPVTKPYKLVLREMRDTNTIITIPSRGERPVTVGGGRLALIAGPCAAESLDLVMTAARGVMSAGACMFRAGAFKPRTSPYSFQGLGKEALEMLAQARHETGMPIVTEAVDVETLPLVAEYADVIQIGARNMQNFSLLRRCGQLRKPILLKRGQSATLDELLQSAEYILSEGNLEVILCERGVRTFSDHTRNTLDLSAVPVLKRLTHLPVIVDPSHGTGSRTEVGPMSKAAIAAGADGLIIEVHPCPEKALSDGPQQLTPASFGFLVSELRKIAAAVEREI